VSVRAWLAGLLLVVNACAPAYKTQPTGVSPQDRDLAARLAEIDLCGYERCSGPFHAAEDLDFGAFAMGATVSPVLPDGGDRFSHCTRAQLQNYGPAEVCFFTMDGVGYVVTDGRVVGKSTGVDNPSAPGLPLGLRIGQTPDETLAALRQITNVPFRTMTFPGGRARYVSHDDVLKNTLDHPFLFTLLFVNDRLVQILLQDPSAPSD
jgi:hypothetical protein